MQSSSGPIPNFSVSFVEQSGTAPKTITSDSPPPHPLPETSSTQVPPDSLGVHVRELKQAPDGSAAKNLGDTLDTVKKPFVNLDIGEQLLGISVKDLKTNFKKAMAKDDQAPATILQPSRFLRKSGRVMSLSLGMALNFTSRLVACAFGVAGSAVVLGALTVAFLYNNFDSTMWKNPREAMLLSIGLGAGFGAGCGAVLGTLGNRLVNSSLGIDTTLKEDFLKSMEHNMAAAVVGSSVGTLTAIANPLCWRAAWVKGDD